jgi:putative endonuclease
MHYVYLIKDVNRNKLYIGYTNNLKRRLDEHKNKKPELIYYAAYKDERDARDREKKLKQRGQTIRWLKERIKYSLEK